MSVEVQPIGEREILVRLDELETRDPDPESEAWIEMEMLRASLRLIREKRDASH